MAIKFKCSCGHVLTVPDNLAGKSGKCPKCQNVLKVPKPVGAGSPAARPAARTSAATAPAGKMDSLFDEVGLLQKTGPVCPRCAADIKPETVVCISCGTNLQTGEQSQGYSVRTEGKEFDNLYLQEAASNMLRDIAMDTRRAKAAMPWWVLMSFLIGAITLCAAGVVIVDGIFGETGSPDTFMGRVQLLPVPSVLGSTLGVTGLAIALFAHLSISIFVFGKSVWQGLVCLFLPMLASIPFGIMNWTDNKAPVKALMIAGVLLGLATLMIVKWGGGFSRLMNVL